jgi:hypothetical protein
MTQCPKYWTCSKYRCLEHVVEKYFKTIQNCLSIFKLDISRFMKWGVEKTEIFSPWFLVELCIFWASIEFKITNATFWIFEGPCYGKWTLLNQVLVFWYTICTCGLQIAIFQMLRLFHISKKSYSHTFQNNLERKVFKYNQLTQTFWKTLSFWMIAAS